MSVWIALRALCIGVLLGGCAHTAHAPTAAGPGSPAAAPAPAPAPPGDAERELGPYERQALERADQPTVVGAADLPAVRDPLEPLNRGIFWFNDLTYRYVLSPVGRAYTTWVPQPVKTGVGRFFDNLREPISSLNNLFTAQWGQSGRNLARFGINTTLGLAGVFDPAQAWFELEPAAADFEDTLVHYQLGYGLYLVLPLLGPSDARGLSSVAFDYLTHPAYYLTDRGTGSIVRAVDGVTEQSSLLADYPELVGDAPDRYQFIRNLYMQRALRDAQYGAAE